MSELTAIDDAQDALLALLQEALAESGSEGIVAGGRLSIGWPPNGPEQIWQSEGDWMWIAEAIDDWTLDWPDLPTGRHSESFTLTVTIIAVRPGDASYVEARDRALELARVVSNAIGADFTLGGKVVEVHPSGGRTAGGKTGDGKRAAQVDLNIKVSAYPAD